MNTDLALVADTLPIKTRMFLLVRKALHQQSRILQLRIFRQQNSPKKSFNNPCKSLCLSIFGHHGADRANSLPLLLKRQLQLPMARFVLLKMDIDKHPEVAGQMGIQSIPAVVAFVDGKPADAFMGAKTEGEIRDFISKVAGPSDDNDEMETLLEDAKKLAEQGDIQDAGRIYSHILTADPANVQAIAGVGHLYLGEDNLEGARGVMANLDEEKLSSPEITSLKSAIDLAEQAQALGNTSSDLQAKLDANPEDHQLRLDLAIALNAANKREEAADHLLEIISRKPGWNDDAARIQLLQFFEAWGMTDETTISSRRKLSSLLFS